MTRSINASTITELQKDSFRMAQLIQMDFSTAIRITDWARNLSALSSTFLSSGNFLDFSPVTETSELGVNSATLTLSAVEQTYVAVFLNNNYIDTRFRAWRAVLDTSDAVIGDPILIFDGRITGYQIDEDQIVVEVASHWKDFEYQAGRLTNHNSQQRFFAGDLGFEFSANMVKDLKWGRG